MNRRRLHDICSRYGRLKIALVGDYCLDRYLEIDPRRQEISIETGLPVYNVVNVRSQPGGAGTILNNLAALGAGTIYPVGFCGEDGEGYELCRALKRLPGVLMDSFIQTSQRRTFTYCKPLLMHSDKPPVELNRLDSKNWTQTPPEISLCIADCIRALASKVDAMILLDQVDCEGTGVINACVLEAVREVSKQYPSLPVMADSRRGLSSYPPLIFKMNVAEFGSLMGTKELPDVSELPVLMREFAKKHGRPVIVTASEKGIFAVAAEGSVEHAASLPVRGPIDIVGAGDAVTANLALCLATGTALNEALQIANAAASVVVHKLGTTGTASPSEIEELIPDI